MIWLAVQVLGSALMIGAGILAARRSQKLATWLVGICGMMIVSKIVISLVPAGEARLLPWNGYAYIQHWWVLFPSMVVVAVAGTLFWNSMWKRDGLLIVGGFTLVFFGTIGILMGRPHERLFGTVDAHGICHQTSGYSCSPAAAAMLLHQAGIAATEKEMAELCVTRAGNSRISGTSDVGAMRGLRLKMAGRGWPVISMPSYGQLRAPAMVAIKIHDQLSHSVVVIQVEPDQVKVIDPLYGRGTIPRGQFERDWKGVAINLERSGS